MSHALQPHPDSPCPAVRSLTVAAERSADGFLFLRYRLEGDIDALVKPLRAPPARTDELWKTTCFEAFVRPGEGPGYLEFNMAAMRWAAYRFDDYRQGMADLDLPNPTLSILYRHNELIQEAAWDLGAVAGAGPWRLAITTVIEPLTGGISYWSLHHPPGAPEFHHPEGFVLPLPGPEAA